MAYGADFLTGGTATSSGGYQTPDKGFDNNTATYYQNQNSAPCWIKYDLGAGVEKIGRQYTITLSSYGATYCPSAWVLGGSNNDSDWTQLDSQSGITWSSAYEKKEFAFSNGTAFRYYRWTFSAPNGPICIAELEAMGAGDASPACYLISRQRDRYCTKPISSRNALAEVKDQTPDWDFPTMTSGTTPSPYIVSASSIYGAGYDGWKAFDGSSATWWNTEIGVASAGSWVKMYFGASIVVTGCTIKNYSNSGLNAFKIQGSNNDSDWVDIHSDNCLNNEDVQSFSFTENTTGYAYIRVYCVSGTGTNNLSIREITFSGYYSNQNASNYLKSMRDRMNMRPVSTQNQLE